MDESDVKTRRESHLRAATVPSANPRSTVTCLSITFLTWSISGAAVWQWCYVSEQNPWLVYEIGLSIMWKVSHKGATWWGNRHVTVCVIQSKWISELLNSGKSASHIANSMFSMWFSQLVAVTLAKQIITFALDCMEKHAGPGKRLSVLLICARCGTVSYGVRHQQPSGELRGGINSLFAAADCWEWDALRCRSTNEASGALGHIQTSPLLHSPCCLLGHACPKWHAPLSFHLLVKIH